MLKGMWQYVPEWVTDETTWDSGLIILPHLPREEPAHANRTEHRETTSIGFRVTATNTNTSAATPSMTDER